jgi:hypothetical protein
VGGPVSAVSQPNLFDWPDRQRYPAAPGFKERGGTSQEAAEAIEPRANTLRAKALAALELRALTPDEIADALGESVLAIRPRVTELFNLGRIEWTGEKRTNASGMRAKVWFLDTGLGKTRSSWNGASGNRGDEQKRADPGRRLPSPADQAPRRAMGL